MTEKRKKNSIPLTERFFVSNCLIDPDSHTIQSALGQTQVEPKVMTLLQRLADTPNVTLSREMLINHIWQDEDGSDESLTRLAYMLRKAFSETQPDRQIVRTVPKKGYRLDAKVRPAGAVTQFPDKTIDTLNHDDFSIAVLPIEDTSEADGSRFLAEGMTRDLTTLLSQASRLKTSPYSSAVFFANKLKSPSDILTELKARYGVSGSMTRQDEDIRIRMELFDKKTNKLIWSQKYDGKLDEFYNIQEDIILSISTAISSKVKILGATNLHHPGPFNVEAYRLIQSAETLRFNYGPKAAQEIETLLENVLAIEPENAVARASLAVQLSQTVVSQWTDTPEKLRNQANIYIAEALSSHPNDPDVIASAGIVSTMFHDPDNAIDYLQRAVKMDPNNAQALAVLGWQICLRYSDKSGLEKIKLAETRAPHHPRFGLWATYRCTAHIFLLDYQSAEPACREAIQRTPNYYQPHMSLAWAQAGLGKIEQAKNSILSAKKFGDENIANRFISEMRKWSANSPNVKACHHALDALETAGNSFPD